ncbi:MAG: tetratricopeptide repeat protein [Candidatus Obscuribacterales bacterium]|nr:tetratricopeptide repeat protein [Candidatus Obscuribacterales bacterium]
MNKSRIVALMFVAFAACAALIFSYFSISSSQQPEQKPAWEIHYNEAMKALEENDLAEWNRQTNLVFEEGKNGKMPPQAAIPQEQKLMERLLWFIPMQDRGESMKYTEALDQLAGNYKRQKDFKNAERFYRKSMELGIAEAKSKKSDHIYPFTTTLISFLQEQGRDKEALELKKIGIEEAEQEAKKWPDAQRKSEVLRMKAEYFEIEGKFEQAEDCMKKRVELYNYELSEEQIAESKKRNENASYKNMSYSNFTLDRLNDLNRFYERRKDYEGQERTLKKILSIRELILPNKCELLSADWNNLADLYRKQNAYPKEAEALKKSIQLFETASTWEKLARACERLGKYNEAADALKASIKLREIEKEPESPYWTAVSYNKCATMLEKSGRKDEAEQMREQAKKITQTKTP